TGARDGEGEGDPGVSTVRTTDGVSATRSAPIPRTRLHTSTMAPTAASASATRFRRIQSSIASYPASRRARFARALASAARAAAAGGGAPNACALQLVGGQASEVRRRRGLPVQRPATNAFREGLVGRGGQQRVLDLVELRARSGVPRLLQHLARAVEEPVDQA